MNTDYTYQKATTNDVDFLADVIIGAEKSFTNNLGLANLFELSEEKIKELIIAMLKEEVDGCEFSISSFFIAFYNDKPVGAVGGWAEGLNTDISSNLIKSNLINYLFPKDNVIKAQAKLEMIKELLQIERPAGTYQIEYGYVDNEHRGKRITNMLMDEHFANAKRLDSNIKAVQVSCFETNVTSIRMHEKNGFRQVRRFVCNNEEVLNYMPHKVKVLLEKEI